MHQVVQRLEDELESLAKAGGADDPEAIRALSRALHWIEESSLIDDLLNARRTIEHRDSQSALAPEWDIAVDLRELRDLLEKPPLIYVEGVRIDIDPGSAWQH